MSSKYVVVTDKEKLRKYYEAGVLYYSYGDNEDGSPTTEDDACD